MKDGGKGPSVVAQAWADRLKETPVVRGVYVYGSVAHGDTWRGSNVDLVALVDAHSAEIDPSYVDVASEGCAVKIEFVPVQVFKRYTLLPPTTDTLIRYATVGRAKILYDPDRVIAGAVREIASLRPKTKAALLLGGFGRAAMYAGFVEKFTAMERWLAATPFIALGLYELGLAFMVAHDTLPRKSWTEDLAGVEPRYHRLYRSYRLEARPARIRQGLQALRSSLERLAPAAVWALGVLTRGTGPAAVSEVRAAAPSLSEFCISPALEFLASAGLAVRSERPQRVSLGQAVLTCSAVVYSWKEGAPCAL